MVIKEAKFVVSNTNVEKCPQDKLPEYAFIGRSNVGKSSLINMLVNKKNLAMTSANPGKTMLINHFLINNEWYIVDLPGYGYARRAKDTRDAFKKMIQAYVIKREQMTNLFVLVDGRHAPQKIDMQFIEWLGENGIPFSIVFTKMDKMGINAGKSNVESYKRELLKQWDELPPLFITSSADRRGRDELLGYIESINKEYGN